MFSNYVFEFFSSIRWIVFEKSSNFKSMSILQNRHFFMFYAFLASFLIWVSVGIKNDIKGALAEIILTIDAKKIIPTCISTLILFFHANKSNSISPNYCCQGKITNVLIKYKQSHAFAWQKVKRGLSCTTFWIFCCPSNLFG